jgi:hypothetical protein
VPAGATGLDADGGRIFVGQYSASGNIVEYTTAGGVVNTITTGLPTGSISGLGYDPSNGTFWVATGFGDDMIRQFDASGTQLASFASNAGWINGLDVVTAIPEPSTYALLGLGLASLFLYARKGRFRPV